MKLKHLFFLSLTISCPSANSQGLVETFQLAVKNNPQLEQAHLTQFSVGETKSQSIGSMLPTISISGTSSRDRRNNKKASAQGSGVQHFWDHSFTINFSQPVFHWEHWITLSQSNNRIAQAEAEYQAEYQVLMVNITEAYFNILSAQDNVAFTSSEQQAISKQLQQAKQRFDVGLIAITGVYEAQAGFDLATANQIEAMNLLDDNKETLREIIGDTEVNLLQLREEIDFLPPLPNDIKKWTEITETNNLTIIAALNQAEVSRKESAIQHSAHLPTLDIIANYTGQDVNSNSGLRGDTQSIGLQMNIPIFQGGIVSSQTKQAQFNYQISKQNLIATKRQAKREVRNAFRDVISNLSRVHALKAAVTSAESALEATEAGFEAGTRTMVDVLAELRSQFSAKRDYSRSRYDYLISGVKLKQAASNLTENDLNLIDQYFEK